MTLVLEDHDQWGREQPVADPWPVTADTDWATAFEFAGGFR